VGNAQKNEINKQQQKNPACQRDLAQTTTRHFVLVVCTKIRGTKPTAPTTRSFVDHPSARSEGQRHHGDITPANDALGCHGLVQGAPQSPFATNTHTHTRHTYAHASSHQTRRHSQSLHGIALHTTADQHHALAPSPQTHPFDFEELVVQEVSALPTSLRSALLSLALETTNTWQCLRVRRPGPTAAESRNTDTPHYFLCVAPLASRPRRRPSTAGSRHTCPRAATERCSTPHHLPRGKQAHGCRRFAPVRWLTPFASTAPSMHTLALLATVLLP
jgi:hypothetical protein